MKEAICTKKAPKPCGPYSQAIVSDGFIFISGQDGVFLDGTSAGDSINMQTTACLGNIAQILAASNAKLEDIVFMTCHLHDLTKENTAAFNNAYAAFFQHVKHKPARITVGSQLLAGDVEISAIARKSSP